MKRGGSRRTLLNCRLIWQRLLCPHLPFTLRGLSVTPAKLPSALIKRPPHYLFETLRRWAANYADCILKGERPVDLPVQVPPWSVEGWHRWGCRAGNGREISPLVLVMSSNQGSLPSRASAPSRLTQNGASRRGEHRQAARPRVTSMGRKRPSEFWISGHPQRGR
jgi:hypothetical protein